MFFEVFTHILLVVIFVERIRNTFSNKETYKKFSTTKENLLCGAMTFLYIFILLIAFSHTYTSTYRMSLVLVVFGAAVWLLGVWYRNMAIRALGHGWSIYRIPGRLKSPMSLGPYAYSRHPYYSASILELLGYSFLFQSVSALLLTVLIYLPLIIIRSRQEEEFLEEKFGERYELYRKHTPLIFDLKAFLEDSRFLNQIQQFLWVSKKYGWKRISNIVRMNKAVLRYFRNYMISQSVAALSKIDFWDVLIENGYVDLANFSKERNYDLRIMKLLCDYLHVMRILKKRVVIYSFTNYGHNLICNSRGVFDFIYAYAPIFESLPELIKKEKAYGKEIQRRGEFVGRASAELAELFPFPVARAFLGRHKLSNILDLGSGSGDFLIGFCKEKGIKGVGVDLSPEAVAYATKKARENGVEEAAHFLVGDILKLRECITADLKVDVITSMFVLHEFLSISEQLVLDIFNSVKEAFPETPILICELTRCSLDHLYHSPSGVTEHHLFHYLSNQGLATAGEWKHLFRKANLELIEEERLDLAEQSIFLVT